MMKDKLYKNNHKGSYYRSRRITFFTVAFLSGVLAISIPTYINSLSHDTVKAERLENTRALRLVDNEEKVESELVSSLLEYETMR